MEKSSHLRQGMEPMRELSIYELKAVHAGDCSGWQVAGYTFLATSMATGGVRMISTCSLTQGLQVGFACGVISMLVSIGLFNFFSLLPDQELPAHLCDG